MRLHSILLGVVLAIAAVPLWADSRSPMGLGRTVVKNYTFTPADSTTPLTRSIEAVSLHTFKAKVEFGGTMPYALEVLPGSESDAAAEEAGALAERKPLGDPVWYLLGVRHAIEDESIETAWAAETLFRDPGGRAAPVPVEETDTWLTEAALDLWIADEANACDGKEGEIPRRDALLRLWRVLLASIEQCENLLIYEVTVEETPAWLVFRRRDASAVGEPPAVLVRDRGAVSQLLRSSLTLKSGIVSNKTFTVIDLGDPVEVATAGNWLPTSETREVVFPLDGSPQGSVPYGSGALVRYPPAEDAASERSTFLRLNSNLADAAWISACADDSAARAAAPDLCAPPFLFDVHPTAAILEGFLPIKHVIPAPPAPTVQVKAHKVTSVPRWLFDRLAGEAWTPSYRSFGQTDARWGLLTRQTVSINLGSGAVAPGDEAASFALANNPVLEMLFAQSEAAPPVDPTPLDLDLSSNRPAICMAIPEDSRFRVALDTGDVAPLLLEMPGPVGAPLSSALNPRTRFVLMDRRAGSYVAQTEATIGAWTSFLTYTKDGRELVYGTKLAPWMFPDQQAPSRPRFWPVMRDVAEADQAAVLREFDGFQYFFQAVSRRLLSEGEGRASVQEHVDACLSPEAYRVSSAAEKQLCNLRSFLALRALETYLGEREDLQQPASASLPANFNGLSDAEREALALKMTQDATRSAPNAPLISEAQELVLEIRPSPSWVCGVAGQSIGTFDLDARAVNFCSALRSYWDGAMVNNIGSTPSVLGRETLWSKPIAMASETDVETYANWAARFGGQNGARKCAPQSVTLPSLEDMVAISRGYPVDAAGVLDLEGDYASLHALTDLHELASAIALSPASLAEKDTAFAALSGLLGIAGTPGDVQDIDRLPRCDAAGGSALDELCGRGAQPDVYVYGGMSGLREPVRKAPGAADAAAVYGFYAGAWAQLGPERYSWRTQNGFDSAPEVRTRAADGQSTPDDAAKPTVRLGDPITGFRLAYRLHPVPMAVAADQPAEDVAPENSDEGEEQ